MKKGTLFLIDGTSCLYRAYHAIPPLTTSKGLPSNATYGFAQTLRKILKSYAPEFIGVAFDLKGPTFRHELYEEYKAERPPMPDDLGMQIPYIKKLLKAFNIPVLEKDGFEADDVIGTLVRKFSGSGLTLVVISGDKDMFQLVGDDCRVLDHVNDREYGEDAVREKFGVEPSRIADLMGLAGDPSDNIPGVPGVGVKTAAKLINLFGSLEGVLKNIDRAPGKKLKVNLAEYKEQAVLSKELATLHADVPIICEISSLRYTEPDFKALESLLKELEFTRLIKEVIPAGREDIKTTTVLTEKELKGLVVSLKESRLLAVSLQGGEGEGDGPRPAVAAKPLGIGLSSAPGEGVYIPVLEGAGVGLPEGVILKHLKKPMEDEGVKKSSSDAKELTVFFSRRGVKLKGVVMDTSIASYLLNPTRFAHTLENVAYAYLGVRPEEATPEGVSAAAGACGKASIVLRLTGVLEKRLKEAGLTDLFHEMELPLSRVLADMELVGVKVDRKMLEDLSVEIDGELKALEGELYGAAGYRFNINSPKQLSVLLFEKLKLKPLKKTKTGYSTDETVLTTLSEVHEIPRNIMNYRQLAKLKGTYVDAMLALIDPATGRIHTSFNQTVTATGRLSSSRPNLQNIPIRNEFARKIREAFVAEEGCLLLSADYSQIELRLVAHFSKDPVLIDAFTKDEDVHTRTASEVFGLAPELVSGEMRRRAKAINFGIIYGMGPYGLSLELGITVAEAKEYIDSYFEHYGAVREFIDTTVREAKKKGYTKTLFGRRRFIPELKSPNEGTVRFGERMAINTPVQGSAADIIKAAMIRIDKRLKAGGLRTRMILQIHDELVFEMHEDEQDEVKELVAGEMEGVQSLDVSIKVNLKYGSNWRSVE
jgi:DNA polymerase-1